MLLTFLCLYPRTLTPADSISISVWNARKSQVENSSGFLGCLHISPKSISKLRDAGRK